MTYTDKRAWLYTRIDTPADNHGILKEQEKALYDYAGQMMMSIAGSSSDLGGGHDFERPGLMQATAAAREGRFDILLVKSLGRLGRDVEQTCELIRQFNELGAKVCSPLEGEISLESPLFTAHGARMEQGGLAR